MISKSIWNSKNKPKKRYKFKFLQKNWKITNPPGGKIKKSPLFEQPKKITKNTYNHKNIKQVLHITLLIAKTVVQFKNHSHMLIKCFKINLF